MDSDYIYRPKKVPTEDEMNAVRELSKIPTMKSVLMGLAILMAFRPLINATSNQCELVMSDIASNIIREKFSETSVIWAIEKLKGGNSEYGGRNFPTRDEIISEIRKEDKKINIILKAFSEDSGTVPNGYHIDSRLDWLFDQMDAA